MKSPVRKRKSPVRKRKSPVRKRKSPVRKRKTHTIFERIKQAIKSIKLNYLFWISCFISIIIIKQKTHIYTYTDVFFSFIASIVSGWLIHYGSHYVSFTKMVNDLQSKTNLLQKNIIINKIIEFFSYNIDFHDKIHHNSNINKRPINIFIEAIHNFITQTCIVFILSDITLFNKKITMCKPVIFFWGLLYVTTHNINYNIINSSTHIQHHINKKTNYGIDILDILFDTKYDMNEIENMNHICINVIIITIIILFFYGK